MPIKNQSVAVVDDDSSMRQAVERLLNAAGFRTFAYPSAETFLKSAERAEVACLIVDIHLPGLSGFELQQRLAGDGKPHPVIFITAHDEPDSQARAKAAGAVAFIQKPFQGHDLIAAIHRAFGAAPAQP
jgi:FixJ family two-component response regulator